MKLYITPWSPYARKCRIVLREKGLLGRCDEIVVDPFVEEAAIAAANPVAQVPALVTDEGVKLTNSPLICAWLDRLGPPRLIPDGEAQWPVRRLEALADAAQEMGVKLLLEKRRPEAERSPHWTTRWRNGLDRALDALEAWDIDPEAFDLGVISTGCCITWIGFRHPEIDVVGPRPRLRALQATLEARPSFLETAPL